PALSDTPCNKPPQTSLYLMETDSPAGHTRNERVTTKVLMKNATKLLTLNSCAEATAVKRWPFGETKVARPSPVRLRRSRGPIRELALRRILLTILLAVLAVLGPRAAVATNYFGGVLNTPLGNAVLTMQKDTMTVDN